MSKNRNDLDIRSLKYFIAAAEHLNFTSASKECFITQTAMSMHIAKIYARGLFIENLRSIVFAPIPPLPFMGKGAGGSSTRALDEENRVGGR